MESIQKEIKELRRLLEYRNLGNKDFFTVEDAIKYLGTSKSHLYKLTSKKEIPHYCPTGKKIYFKKTEIDEWIVSSRVPSVADSENEVKRYLCRE